MVPKKIIVAVFIILLYYWLGNVNVHGAGHPDGVELMIYLGPGLDEVTLDWNGGQPSFEMFRALYPDTVDDPTNKIGETDDREWIDTSTENILFYFISSPCVENPPEVCDGADNDCDGEIDEDYVSIPTTCGEGECTGNTGQLECQNGVEVDTCDPFEGATPDVCDGLDNDCDPSTPDGSDDPLQGLPCDGPDSDLCEEGYYFCSSASLDCSDYTGNSTEICNNIDDDCDGLTDEGFLRDDNPPCLSGQPYIGSVSGDTGTDVVSYQDWSEEWCRFLITEDDSLFIPVYLSATVELWSPPGTDYDLYVYCDECNGDLAGYSTSGGSSGHYDTVDVRSNDSVGVNDDYYVIVEVRHFSSSNCDDWVLAITGNTNVSNETCD